MGVPWWWALHRRAAAGAAVADGVKAPQHGLLEEGVVHVAARVLGLEDGHRLRAGDGARALRVVLEDEAGEGLADDQADVQWQAGVLARDAAGAIEHHQVFG